MGRIIYYNAIKCQAFLAEGRYRSDIEPFLADAPDLDERKAVYASFFRFLNARPYFDRTSARPCFLDVELLFPIPERDPAFPKTFREVCLERARELVAKDRPIEIFWSGGIDSTAALAALLLTGVPHEQLTVILNDHSIAEYPLFFERFVAGRLRFERVDRGEPLSRRLRPDVVGVTGEPGDQLFGNLNKLLTRLGWDHAFEPFADLFPADLVDAAAPILEASPVEIVTLHDFCWWMNFVLKYQQTSLRLLANLQGERDVSSFRAGLFPFYGTTDFQQWSMNNHDRKTRDTFESFKYEAKDLIHEVTGDADYRDSKIKIGSLQANRDPDWLFILKDGTVVYPDDSMDR